MNQFNDFLDYDNNINIENEDDIRVNIDEYQQSIIWATDWTTGTIVAQLEKGTIDMKPKFQRREAWDDHRKSRFIESIILGLPIPQIILAERKEKKGTYIVIDGKQRLLSIKRFFANPLDNNFIPLKLIGLDSLGILNGKSFSDLQNDFLFEDYVNLVENQSIRTIIIKNWPTEEFLYNVFLRLNTGSLPLAPQELRQALHPGKFIDFVDDFSINSHGIKKVLGIDKPDYRMRDVELVIRYFAFKKYWNSYDGNLKYFFDRTVKKLNTDWEKCSVQIVSASEELEKAIDFSYRIWGDNTFRKWKNGSYQNRFNRAIYDIMVFYFSESTIREAAQNYLDEIRKAFEELCERDNDFLNSFEASTKNIDPTEKRFSTWGEKLSQICKVEINPFRLPKRQS